MRSKSVAVLNIRSDEITGVIAERGVNNTFIIKNKYSHGYEGYAEGKMLDKEDFTEALKAVTENLISSGGGKIRRVFVGVPCEFLDIVLCDRVMAFPSAKKITLRQIEDIKELSRPQKKKGYKIIGCDCLYFHLSDKRKLLNPVGAVSDSLRAKTCFYVCKTGFIKAVKEILSCFEEIESFSWIAQNQAEAGYLIPAEKRGGSVALFDFGYISSTFSLISGNGVEYSEPFSIGVAHMAVAVMEALSVPYDVAYEYIKKINLNSKDRSSALIEINVNGNLYSVRSSQLKEVIREGLDGLCEMVEVCRESCPGRDISSVPVLITGEGVGVIRGSTEHIASRLVVPLQVTAPPVPFYDKPSYSSILSLLSSALDRV